MAKLLLAEQKQQATEDDPLQGENPLAKYPFHSPSKRAARRERINALRGGHARRR